MLKPPKLTHQGLILVSIPLVCQYIFVLSLVWLQQKTEYEARKSLQSKEVVNATQAMLRSFYDFCRINTVYTLSKNAAMGERSYAIATEEIPRNLHELKSLVARSPYQKTRYEELVPLVHKLQDLFVESREAADGNPGREYWSEMGSRVTPIMTAAVVVLKKINDQEMATQKGVPEAEARYRQLLIGSFIAGMVLNTVLAVVLIVLFNRFTAGRLQTLLNNTDRLARGQELPAPLIGTDELAHLDRVFHDMAAALQELMRKERATVANVSDVICSMDERLKFASINPAAQIMWGYTPSELQDLHLTDIIWPGDDEKTMQAIAETRKSHTTAILENRIRKADGQALDALWSISWSDDDKLFFAVAHNISERKQLERMKQEFVAMVSHDLRTPLTSIQGMLELLGMSFYGKLTDSGMDKIRITENSVNRLIKLINDLLDIEKLESGKMELHCETISEHYIVTQAAEAVRDFANQHEVQLQIQASEANIYADPDRLIQVLVNLISNAVKFSPPGRTVTVSTENRDKDTLFRVTDEGRGVPAVLKEAIFERFKQVDKSDATEKKGSGLGLAICKAIVNDHSGSIGVESEDGKGSTFWFTIPKPDRTAGS